jgi:hypothetical protein
VAAQSKAWVCCRSLVGIAGSNLAGGINICLLLSAVYFHVDVPGSGWSLIQSSPTECGVSECDREASIMRRPWRTRGCCAIECQRNLTHDLPFYLFQNYFNIILPSMPVYHAVSFLYISPPQPCIRTIPRPHTCHMSGPSYYRWK